VENVRRGARAGVSPAARVRDVVVPLAVSVAIHCAPPGFPRALARRSRFTRDLGNRVRGIRLACAHHRLKNSLADPWPAVPRTLAPAPAMPRYTHTKETRMVAIARLHTAAEIAHHLDQHVVGQSLAKRRLGLALYRHYLGRRFRDSPCSGGRDFGSQHQLLLGPTGVGKSLLVKTVGAFLGVPVAFIAATALVETGYVGTPVEAMFAALLERAGGDVALAEHGIVFLDEFDKLRRATDIGRDVSGEGVQNGLLTLLDGRPVRVRWRDHEVSLDSSRILFLCTGAFAGLTAHVRARLDVQRSRPLGFAARSERPEPLGETELLDRVTPEDLIAFGLIPELVGRFSGLVPLHPLTRAELERVLADLPRSPLALERRFFELHGVRLEVGAEARAALVERALEQGLGARTLHRLVADTLAPLEFRLPRLAEEGVGAVRLTRAAVEGEAEPELVSQRDLDEWHAPFPSARELSQGGLGRTPRPASPPPPPPRPRDLPPRRRFDPQRDPRPGSEGPTLFGPEA
jgi:ATP-dependent Clp protease ATP-binding subunit ClpX